MMGMNRLRNLGTRNLGPGDDNREIQDAEHVDGEADAISKITLFIQNLMKSHEVEGSIPLELHQMGYGANEAIFTLDHELTASADESAQEIVERASQDAQGIGRGSCRYKVSAVGVKLRVTFSLKVITSEGIDDEGDIDEHPNMQGVTHQLMRHNEKFMAFSIKAFDKLNGMTMRLLHEKDERIRNLESDRLTQVKSYEELIDHRHARDLEFRKLENGERRQDQVAGILMQGIPTLINAIASRRNGGAAPALAAAPPLQETVTPLENMVEGLLSTFDSTQFGKIAQSGVFTPAQLMQFAEIAKAVQQRQMDAEEARLRERGQAPPAGTTAAEEARNPPVENVETDESA